MNFRADIFPRIVSHFKRDNRYYLLAGDMGFAVLDAVKQSFPRRVVNCGIMEQATVGIAAGMSMAGLVPIVYSIVNFIVFRSLEQIRNDVVLQGLNVKFIGTGANDYFHFLGASHCCGSDDVSILNLIHPEVFDPYTDERSLEEVVDAWMTSEKAGYLRV